VDFPKVFFDFSLLLFCQRRVVGGGQEARTPPDAFRLEVPVPRQHPQSKTTRE
jgi:hypothetical protein